MEGLRLSLIYGECENFKGLDLGIINNTRADFAGIALGGANLSGGKLRGGQLGLVNVNNNGLSDWDSLSIGAQLGLVNYADSFCGLQDALFLSVTSEVLTGWQSAFVNMAGAVYGCQCGLLNVAEDLHGAQCGFYAFICVNYAAKVRGCQLGIANIAGCVDSGVQIGLVNINTGNGWAPVLPIINGGF